MHAPGSVTAFTAERMIFTCTSDCHGFASGHAFKLLEHHWFEPGGDNDFLVRKAGSYVLEKRPERGGVSLRARLHQASMFVAGSPALRLSSIAEVQATLDQPADC